MKKQITIILNADGKRIDRKVRHDDNGEYILANNMHGYLKTVRQDDTESTVVTVKQVAYYI